jgi:hypothetical protein
MGLQLLLGLSLTGKKVQQGRKIGSTTVPEPEQELPFAASFWR